MASMGESIEAGEKKSTNASSGEESGDGGVNGVVGHPLLPLRHNAGYISATKVPGKKLLPEIAYELLGYLRLRHLQHIVQHGATGRVVTVHANEQLRAMMRKCISQLHRILVATMDNNINTLVQLSNNGRISTSCARTLKDIVADLTGRIEAKQISAESQKRGGPEMVDMAGPREEDTERLIQQTIEGTDHQLRSMVLYVPDRWQDDAKREADAIRTHVSSLGDVLRCLDATPARPTSTLQAIAARVVNFSSHFSRSPPSSQSSVMDFSSPLSRSPAISQVSTEPSPINADEPSTSTGIRRSTRLAGGSSSTEWGYLSFLAQKFNSSLDAQKKLYEETTKKRGERN